MSETTIQINRFAVSGQRVLIALQEPPAKEDQKLENILEPFGRIQPVAGKCEFYVLQLSQPVETSDELVGLWRRIQKVIGDLALALPVILDEEGQRRFPSGSINVRFPEVLTDDELKTWASDRDLKPKERNRYVPQQVAFTARQPTHQFFGEILQNLERKGKDEMFWPETYSEYHRE